MAGETAVTARGAVPAAMDTALLSHRPLKQIASVTPLTRGRAWQTAVHSRLPLLATCDANRSVNLYSLSDFTKLGSGITGGHKRSIRTVSWKPNTPHEAVLATGSFDASVGIWRRDDDYAIRSSTANNLAASEEIDFTDGRGEADEHEEEEEWRFALVLDGHDSEVKSVAWSSGGNLLATCARDKSVWIWEEVGEDDYETIAVLQEHSADVKCVVWHPEEELLASGSYDDDIRLWREDVDDWDCVALLRGHSGTVWMLDFEGLRPRVSETNSVSQEAPENEQQQELSQHERSMRQAWTERREASGPRLVSCSGDRTVRIWRRVPRERKAQNTMSIIRTGSIEEDWVEEAQLPQAHMLDIYAVAWSAESGRIVSTGADGKIVIYEERWSARVGNTDTSAAATDSAVPSAGAESKETQSGAGQDVKEGAQEVSATEQTDDKKLNTTLSPSSKDLDGVTSWHIVAQQESAHSVYEINHVTWSRRVDKGGEMEDVSATDGAGSDQREMIISTGDDGKVIAWSLSTE